MTQDPRTIVRTTTRLWSEEVARAEAASNMETAGAPFPKDSREDAYRFSGRTFRRPNGNPYYDPSIHLPPESLFTTQEPVDPSATDGSAYEMGMKFMLSKSGLVTGIRYYKASGDSGTHVGSIWSASGALLAAVTFTGETASGWQEQDLETPLQLQADTTYVVSVNVISRFPISIHGLQSSIENGVIASVADGANGVFGTSGEFPNTSFQNSNYFRDIVLIPDI